MPLFIGLMSGTSLDGVDGVLVDIDESGTQARPVAHHHVALDAALRGDLLALNHSGADEMHRAALAANSLARHYADVVQALLAASGTPRQRVAAVGAHGQTVRHRPAEFDGTGYTLQLLNGALLAELCGIDVICDLRSRDVAAGGQGAPLAPGLHAALFATPGTARAVLNLGGIANLTLLPPSGAVTGFDCGPANALMDGWCARHLGQPFDAAGRWAARGRVATALLDALRKEPWLEAPPPKSTGRDLFHLGWLDVHVARHAPQVAPVDVQATLLAFTVDCVQRHLQRHAPATEALFVCGGGAFNDALMAALVSALPSVRVDTTAALGLPVDQVEAAAFAWLAHRFVTGHGGNLPTVTGARGDRRLGALYPAH
ncbi:MAG TPA: anhydro-N-acetylmuramic acid kinase [Burkholderiaceae bacterium]|nr:anhydro-N-acetylmuramic acid kinase [Burkholderiaceae bacterium]